MAHLPELPPWPFYLPPILTLPYHLVCMRRSLLHVICIYHSWVHYALDHTVDISPHNSLVNWVMGYLNCQVVHHLFPQMPQFRQPVVSKRLRAFCAANGLDYKVMTYFGAIRATFKNLDDVGKHYHAKGIDKNVMAQAKADVGTLKRLRTTKRSREARTKTD